jgi:hypothetical protein
MLTTWLFCSGCSMYHDAMKLLQHFTVKLLSLQVLKILR